MVNVGKPSVFARWAKAGHSRRHLLFAKLGLSVPRWEFIRR